MNWLPQTTDNSTYIAQSLGIGGIKSRLYYIKASQSKYSIEELEYSFLLTTDI